MNRTPKKTKRAGLLTVLPGSEAERGRGEGAGGAAGAGAEGGGGGQGPGPPYDPKMYTRNLNFG